MSKNLNKNLNLHDKLLYQRGVSSEYFAYSGERVFVAEQIRLNFLRAMHYDLGDPQQLQTAIFELDAKPWTSWLDSLSFMRQDTLDLRVHPSELNQIFNYVIDTESGQQFIGHFKPADLTVAGEYHIEHSQYTARRWRLPTTGFGYHKLRLVTEGKQLNSKFVCAPEQCYQPSSFKPTDKYLGISCQLYTLRSERNWGIGDFSDLRELIALSANYGIQMVGLNPLHAPLLSGADFASPYSPSDRRFLNVLAIAPDCVLEFAACAGLQDWLASANIQSELVALRAQKWVDYARVEALKRAAFQHLFADFTASHLSQNTQRAQDFNQFVATGADALHQFCEFEVEQARVRKPAVFKEMDCLFNHQYYAYLQWLAQQQLRDCQMFALHCGMQVGLLGDLAVGAVKGGAEVSGNPDLYHVKATVGAPPDQFSDSGQNWDLPVIDPVALRASNYRHFIDLIRANMRNYGALRIDHVMGLMRLWWWLEDGLDGAYVYYPLEDLLAILRLESHRNQCLVIGEDMGVVPDEFRREMQSSAITSSKVFFFETHHDGRFLHPHEQPRDALLMVTSHDVPTLAGWWGSKDIRARERYNLISSSSELEVLLAQRETQKTKLLEWLEQLELLPQKWRPELEAIALAKPFNLELCGAIIRANARSNCKLMLFQLDDLQMITAPVNIPGTFKEYPNWRRKQVLTSAAIFADKQIKPILRAIQSEREI